MFVLDRVAKKSAMEAQPVRDTHARRRASLLERLVNLVEGFRPTADPDIARAVNEAFASLAREYRR